MYIERLVINVNTAITEVNDQCNNAAALSHSTLQIGRVVLGLARKKSLCYGEY